MDIHERREEIKRLLDEKDYISVDELSKALEVSSVTIRSDLASLEKKGVLRRTHGGATSLESKSRLRVIANTLYEHQDEKVKIARKASTLVHEDQTVIVDAGSTTLHVAKLLTGKGVTMVSGSIPAIESVIDDPTIDVMVLGGTLRKSSQSTMGPFACKELDQLHVDILFMGAAGYNSSNIFCSNVIEAETKQEMIRSADLVCFLADSTKEGKKAFATVCAWNDIDIFITDVISKELRAELEEKGVKLILAD